ncbi:histidine kinase [Fusibacter bizertensis]
MKFNYIKGLTVIIAMSISLVFETASLTRMFAMLGLSGAFIALSFIRGQAHRRFSWTLFLDIIVIFFLNQFTRFNVNYVYLLFNLWILAEIVLYQSIFKLVIMVATTLFASAVAFAHSLSYGMNYQLISQAIFVEFILILFAVMLYLYRSYQDEKRRVDLLNTQLIVQNEALSVANDKMILTNEALAAANLEVEKLTKLKERSQFARDLHDTVGHELTGLIMLLEMLKLTCKEKTESQGLQEGIDQAREILRAMRALVNANKDIISHENLYVMLKQKMDHFTEQTGIATKLNFQLFDEPITDVISEALYKIVIESMTNTAKHGAAKQLWVSFQSLSDGELILKIHDDGGSGQPVILGNGLKFIKDRVKRLGGSVTFESDEYGFRTTVKTPFDIVNG